MTPVHLEHPDKKRSSKDQQSKQQNKGLWKKVADEMNVSGLDQLPVELEHNFSLMRNLDVGAQVLMRDIDKMNDDFLANFKKMDLESREKVKDQMNVKFNKVKEYSDDKVQLSVQTYELVDKHIRKLDAELAKFEADMRNKNLNVARNADENVVSKRGRKKLADKGKGSKRKSATSEEESSVAKSVAKKKSKKGSSIANGVVPNKAGTMSTVLENPGNALLQVVHSSDGIDMPVDPNEPTYCLCNQVSYGEMIGCDNSDCPIEWFHFACVNLTTKPKGKWYCPKCTLDRKKK